MTMILGCKRLLAPYADLFEPLQKRGRADAYMAGPEEDPGCADLFDSLPKRAHADAQMLGPDEKRPRLGAGPPAGPAAPGGGAEGEACSSGAGGRETSLRGWAEAITRALVGCPSLEEAAQRCERVLVALEAEVQQAALREADAVVAEAAPETVQGLQHTKRVLMRAIHHLAQRCRKVEASAGDVEELREALERSQEAQRRLAHANELLKGHLRLHLDGCR